MLSGEYTLLRRKAEERIKQWSNCEPHVDGDLHQVIDELKIHLAEQEILNEELRLAMDVRHNKDESRFESICRMFFLYAQFEKGDHRLKQQQNDS